MSINNRFAGILISLSLIAIGVSIWHDARLADLFTRGKSFGLSLAALGAIFFGLSLLPKTFFRAPEKKTTREKTAYGLKHFGLGFLFSIAGLATDAAFMKLVGYCLLMIAAAYLVIVWLKSLLRLGPPTRGT